MKIFTLDEIASHKDAGSGMYVVIDDGVYDVTSEFKIPEACYFL